MSQIDPSLSKLIATALDGDDDDQAAWEAIWALRERGDEATFEATLTLLHSSSPKERRRAADILSQLGAPTPTDALRTRCADALLAVIGFETNDATLASFCGAFAHLRDARAVPLLITNANHADANVRLNVVHGLMSQRAPATTDALIALSTDSDEDIRNWATFALGSMSAFDSPALRDTLVARLADLHHPTQGEALAGLALRKDPRVHEPLRRALAAEHVDILAVEAAGSLGDRSLRPLLIRLEARSTDASTHFKAALETAISALTSLDPVT